MASIPLDLITDILIRLPVKQLLCFRCVSQLWRSLIDDPDFIQLHLRHSIDSNTNQTLILKNSHLHAAHLPSLAAFSKLDYPLMSYNHRIQILGSCNGLLCIRNIVEDMAIWNPFTRKHQVLPSVSSCNVDFYGFGHDRLTDDYKVVKINQFGKTGSEVKVFSLKRNRWRKIQDIPCQFSFPEANGVFAGGALHWVLTRKVQRPVENVIVALDLVAENYREVPQPEYKDKGFHLDVGVLGGCLCAVANYGCRRVDLWMMKDYGVKDSWSKLFSVASEEVTGSLRFVKPLAFSRSGNQVLMEHDYVNLFWHDLNKKEKADRVRVPGMPLSYETEICLQSLVSLNVNRKQHNEEDGTDIKKMDEFLSEGFKLVL
ncbi:hypothetical protein PTKIN_Ptkin18bG0154100 [Pterospermum kingtungense]